jgi:hypothetical protein
MYTKTENKWRYSQEYQEVTTSKDGIIEGSKSICAISTFDKSKEEIESNGKLISAAPEMFEALKRVEAYLVANEDVLAPFPTRSELDNIRAAMFKTGLYQYGG